MLPTSLPGAIPAGITAARPTSARAASRARVGMDATSSGVLPSRAATGRSAQPSGTHTTYFTASVWQALCAPRHEYRQTRTMARLHDIVLDCRHPASLARFWAATLDGYAVAPYDEAELVRL